MEKLDYKILIRIPGYEILEELGRGGMSTVYLALQKSLQRKLALKVMSSVLSVDRSFNDRFMREGRTLGQLSHPNIVTVYDIGLSANRYFIAMEYVAGGTLGERIQHGLPIRQSLGIIKDIARALHYAHRRGFVHRDVKPSNILFRDDGTPVLADFGIARPLDANTRLTTTGLSVGTPNYMSPEQVSGQDVDCRSDLYSLGIVFYEMLTGHRPYHGESAIATSLKHLTEPVPRLPQDLGPLQPVMERMLAKRPAHRFRDEQEFIEALESVLAESDSGKPLSPDHEFSGWALSYPETGGEQAKHTSQPRASSPARPPSRNDLGASIQGSSGPSARRPRWKVGAGLAVAAVLAAVGALLVLEPALNPATQRAVDHLLRIAERYLSAGQLIEPEGFNAYQTYREVLEITPDSKRALSGLHQIAEHFYAAAEAKRKAGAAKEGLELIAEGLKVEPEHEGLLELRGEIAQQLENEKRQQEVAVLLATAQQQFNDGRLVEPANDNAAESYRDALKLDAQNQEALQGLRGIADRLEDLARIKQNSGDVAGALADIEKGLEIDSQHDGLTKLKQQITIEIQLAKAERLLRNDYLVAPPGENAVETYRKVLSAGPNSEQEQRAQVGLRDIAVRMAARARRAEAAGDLDAALAAITQGRKAVGDYPELVSLETKLRRTRQQKKIRQQRVAPTKAPLPAAVKEAQERLEQARLTHQPIRTFRDTLKDGSQGPEMVIVPPGRFAMGASPGEKGSFRDEGPQRTVTLASAFALGRHEVKMAEFRHFVSDTDYRTDAERGEGCHVWTGDRWALTRGMDWQTPGFAQTGAHPVLCVSWNDAVAYTNWLSKQTGKRYRLPSEAEWEYASRAGSSTARHWGDAPGDACGYANVADRTIRERFSNFTVHDCTDGYVRTAPVGTFKPNRFELYDTLGNVWEWTADCWNTGYVGAPTDGSAWLSDDCSRRVLRGGSWGTKPSYVRSASRYGLASDDREDFVGFRLARDL